MTMNKIHFFAADLGATSGRTILGTLDGSKIEMEELTRFGNPIIQCCGHYFWDIYALYNEIIKGLKKVAEMGIQIQSIGIDTWGVDFVCVGKDGMLLGNPYSYRDPHTFQAMEDYFRLVPKEQVYAKTGIQFMNFNSLFQLAALTQENSSVLAAADKVLFMPDALSYLLTGKMVTEYSIASTSQILNPKTKQLDEELLAAIGLKPTLFADMVYPGTQIGVLTEEVQQMTGLGAVPVIAVAGHDTASAVASVPARNEKFAYLSSGTWSLMGIEAKDAIINEKSFAANFTNEGGVEGTTRFLKNICGMWLLESCRREWKDNLSYDTLIQEAMQVEAFRSVINPDSRCFANPSSMVEAIQHYCQVTGQPVPSTVGELTRCIFDSLALRYRQVMNMLRDFAEFPIERLHIIGGGSRNKQLSQFTANAVNMPVTTGPVEGTAIGNIMLQAKAADMVQTIGEMRALISQSIETEEFLPQDAALWDEGYEKYLKVYHEDI